MVGNLENSVATELEEVSFHFNPKERQCHVISHASKFSCSVVSGFKVVLKIVQARFQQYVNRECLDVQAGFRKGRGTGEEIGNIRWLI